MALLVCNRAQSFGGKRVRFLTEGKMGDRVALQTVRPTLKDNKLARKAREVSLDLAPSSVKFGIAGAGRQGQIELGAGSTALASFFARACAGIQMASVFVNIGKANIGIVFEAVKYAIAVMGIDIDVSNAFKPIATTQQLRRHTAIVEYAKAGRMTTTRMM
jgi:hypothetical protein